MSTALIVDDDVMLQELLGEFLKEEGFSCLAASSGESAFEILTDSPVDIVILDVKLPGMSGFEVLRRLRSGAKTADLPVVILSAKGGETDRVVGLELGADDYVQKPFSARELAARLRAVGRRTLRIAEVVEEGDTPLVAGDLTIHVKGHYVVARDSRIDLSLPEMTLLTLLVRNAGKAVSRDYLYDRIYGRAPYPADRGLDMLVSRVRKKLGPRVDGGERIRAARGEGYTFLVAAG